jgi:hypothetical protein
LIGIVAIAMVLSIAFSGLASASQPLCPTPETETIKTVTQISCIGMVTETEKLTWESSNQDLIDNPPLGDDEVVGVMKYFEDLKVTDGATEFVKDLDVDTGDTPNLNVMKSIGYTQGPTIGSLAHTEEVSFGVVADWTATSGVILCPFAGQAQTSIPASCEDVKASSSMVVTDVLTTSVTRVDITASPLALHYEVDARGSGALAEFNGEYASGHIAAEFEVYVEDGSGAGGVGGAGHCDGGNVSNYDLGSTLTHYEKSTADGLWLFHKQMDYKSMIRP